MVSVSRGQYLILSETGGVQYRKRRILILQIGIRFQFEANSGGVYREKHGQRRAPLARSSVVRNSDFLKLLHPRNAFLRLQLSLSQHPPPFIQQHHPFPIYEKFEVSIPISLLECGFL